MQIRARNVYSQSLENQQVNLIARAKLGSHFRSRRVQFFNSLGIIKNKLWDRRIVWWFCSQIFFAHFGASFASSSAAATPKGTPTLLRTTLITLLHSLRKSGYKIIKQSCDLTTYFWWSPNCWKTERGVISNEIPI